MELYIINKFIFIYINKKESNPGSVGRLGACLIHASLFYTQEEFIDGVKVSIIKEPKLLFEKTQLNVKL